MMTMPAAGSRPASGAPPMTPGRWAALAASVPVALALIGWTAFSLVSGLAHASFPVNLTFHVHDGQLAASTGGGSVIVRQDQAAGTTARLAGTVQYNLFRPHLSVTSAGVSLGCRLPTADCALTAVLDVPRDTAVRLASGGGNISAGGIDSGVILHSGGGDVDVWGIGGAADIYTGGGNVTAAGLGGTLRLSTSGGDVNASGLFAPQVTAYSGGGNVTLAFTRAPEDLTIGSSGGDITVILPRGSTRYSISYNASGGDYSATVPTGRQAGHAIRVDSGGGNIRIAEAT